MARNPTLSKPATTEIFKTKTDTYSSILKVLADPSKYDDILLQRLANVFKNEPVISKSSVRAKQGASQLVNSSEEKRRFAMGAANAASQSLGVVVQSGWTASNPDVAGLSTNGVLRIVSSFRMAISLLRELMPRIVDVVRVVSSFIGKLLAIQLVSCCSNIWMIYRDVVASMIPHWSF